MKKRMSPLEKHIQHSIEEFLALHEEMGNLVYQKNNTGAVRIERPGKRSSFMRFGKKGSPDFLVWRRHFVTGIKEHIQICQTLFIEVKTDVGQQSEGQRKFQLMVENMGGTYYIVRSFEEVKQLVLCRLM